MFKTEAQKPFLEREALIARNDWEVEMREMELQTLHQDFLQWRETDAYKQWKERDEYKKLEEYEEFSYWEEWIKNANYDYSKDLPN